MAATSSGSQNQIDFTSFILEPHVQKALRWAIYEAKGRPLTAGALLLSVVHQNDDSPAFAKWASFFPEDFQRASPRNMSPAEAYLTSVPVSPGLANSFDTGRKFFDKSSEIWGRDYITTALLSIADPSLEEIEKQTGRTLTSLRSEWFWFVTSDLNYSGLRRWADWWKAQDLPVPERPTTYLLTWDPIRSSGAGFAGKKSVTTTWSVGNHGARRGDRVFLMRHDQKSAGLVGSGQIVSDVREGPHWDRTKPSSWTAFYADIKWEFQQESPLISVEELIKNTGEKRLWAVTGSGLPILEDLAASIETLWSKALSSIGIAAQNQTVIEAKKTVSEGTGTKSAAAGGSPDVWMLSDRPIESRFAEHDRFQFKDYATALAAIIDHGKTETPFTIAINAPWGAGKTTLANMLAEELKQRPKDRGETAHIICWFNAWMNDDAPNLATAFVSAVGRTANRSRTYLHRVIHPLPSAMLEPASRKKRIGSIGILLLLPTLTLLLWLASQLESIDKRKKEDELQSLQTTTTVTKDPSQKILSTSDATIRKSTPKTRPRDAIEEFLDSTQSRILVLGTFFTAIAGVLSLLAKCIAPTSLGSFIESPEGAAGSGAIQTVAVQLGRLISQATRGRNRFIVFVDDIERCTPPRSIEVLDAVNQLMNHKDVVVVILGDMSAVAAAAQLKYKDLAEIFVPDSGITLSGPERGKEAFGRLYLQKIVQFQFDLPVLPTGKVKRYLNLLAAKVQAKE